MAKSTMCTVAAAVAILLVQDLSAQQFSQPPNPPNPNQNQPPPPPPGAPSDTHRVIAILSGTSGVTGKVAFQQNGPGEPVLISGSISGLKPNSVHGFHIHQYGDMSNGCASMGVHFNPDKHDHGAQDSPARHVGDLGNIQANENGVAQFMMQDAVIALGGPSDIRGRGVVVHELQDDLGQGTNADTRTTGNAGARLACGAIVVTADN